MSANEKIFIGLRCRKGYTNEIKKLKKDDSDLTIIIQPKVLVAKKVRLCVSGYSQGEYLYSREGLVINYKEYGVNKQKHAIS